MLRIRYVGPKERPFYFDRYFGTRTIWEGYGDIQEIDDEDAARRLCRACPSLFEIVLEDSRQRPADSRVPSATGTAGVPERTDEERAEDRRIERATETIRIPSLRDPTIDILLRDATLPEMRAYVRARHVTMKGRSRSKFVRAIVDLHPEATAADAAEVDTPTV